MKVAKFEDGTPTEWIDVMNALEEIWKQNSLTTGSCATRELGWHGIQQDSNKGKMSMWC
jgi:hypothetical protein